MKQKNNNKLYSKAIKYYEEGKLEKALLQCEEAISLNLRNSAALNLKGLLLYLKGNLDEAVATWKINWDFNDDKRQLLLGRLIGILMMIKLQKIIFKIAKLIIIE